MFLLFDVDGTLTVPRNPINNDMLNMLNNCKNAGHTLGCVSGSDLDKLVEQLGGDKNLVLNLFDYVFSENGLVFYHKGNLIHKQSILKYLGEERYQNLINKMLSTLSRISLPLKRSNFIELRNGLINLCPVGRDCSQKEREEFEEYDNQHFIRKKIAKELNEYDSTLKYSIGGQISIDVFPYGWDKTYCLQFINEKEEIQFYGDRIFEGGNDYEIGNHPRVKSFKVVNWKNTYELLNELLNGWK